MANKNKKHIKITECNCDFCTLGSCIKKIIEGNNPEQLAVLVNELQNKILHLSDDLGWYKCVFSGNDPDSFRILTNKLNKIMPTTEDEKSAQELMATMYRLLIAYYNCWPWQISKKKHIKSELCIEYDNVAILLVDCCISKTSKIGLIDMLGEIGAIIYA